ncbi:START domain-containing protein [Marinobacter shengliensis]|uniref:START domain-containing protein n=1 Tax=Marinobacter shengliensis TaxID=1389223 RepID=UPI001E604E28|nr:START domain-containing protein [Marinobacter shengliensis]MCD1629792.1 START domain-containing protein [Marinobacter shengliensis]
MTMTRAHGFKGMVAGVLSTLMLLPLPSLASDHPPLPPEDAQEWTLRKEVDNIRIYTMDQSNSGFQAFKAVANLDVPLENLMAVMINPESCKEWVHNCTESYAFGQGDFHDRYAYSVNDMPWPVTDRDYVLRIRTRGNGDTGEVVMDLNAVPGMRAEFNSRVRVDRSDTLYRFTPNGDKTRMVWVQHTEPNGALPGWLVNNLLVDIPVKSLQALEAVAKEDKYQGYQLEWGENGNLQAVVPADQP